MAMGERRTSHAYTARLNVKPFVVVIIPRGGGGGGVTTRFIVGSLPFQPVEAKSRPSADYQLGFRAEKVGGMVPAQYGTWEERREMGFVVASEEKKLPLLTIFASGKPRWWTKI